MPFLRYRASLKPLARNLRSNMTPQEQRLWSYLRKKQIQNVQFFQQKAIENYIVDFYATTVKLVIEVDGMQHLEPKMLEQDKKRDAVLHSLGLQVLRFENSHIERCLDLVLIEIERYIEKCFN